MLNSMKSRKPSLLSNSAPPRRAAALPKRPNCILLTLRCGQRQPHPPAGAGPSLPRIDVASTGEGWGGGEYREGLSRALPAEPVADRLPHHELLVATLEPRQLFGEHRHALPVGARHAGDVRTPKAALRAERVIDLADVFVDVAIGVRLARIARRPRELDRDIGIFGERQHLAEIGKGGIVLSGAAYTTAPMVVDVQFQPWMALGDPTELGQMPAGHQADWEFFPFA